MDIARLPVIERFIVDLYSLVHRAEFIEKLIFERVLFGSAGLLGCVLIRLEGAPILLHEQRGQHFSGLHFDVVSNVFLNDFLCVIKLFLNNLFRCLFIEFCLLLRLNCFVFSTQPRDARDFMVLRLLAAANSPERPLDVVLHELGLRLL